MKVSEPAEMLSTAVVEIDRLLADNPSENTLAKILIEDIGCCFEPASEGLTSSSWLMSVRSELCRTS